MIRTRARGAGARVRHRRRSSTSGYAPPRAGPRSSAGTWTWFRGSRSAPDSSSAPGVDVNIYPPERAAADLREALGA